jgi:hypothetical protein
VKRAAAHFRRSPRLHISNRYFLNVSRVLLVVLLGLISASPQDNVASIIQRSVEANNRDWAAAPKFDYSERERDNDGSKTYTVTMLFGSPYERLVAINDNPLSPQREREEQKKFENAVSQRRNESQARRSARIAKFEAERKRDHTMMEQLTRAFDFRLLGRENLKGHKVFVIGATPRQDYRPPNRDSQVLTGMEGKLWVDEETFQWVKVEAHVTRPVGIMGFLARVDPGTQFQLEKLPVSGDIWLATHFSVKSNTQVMLLVRRRSEHDEAYYDYHPASPSSASVGRAAAKTSESIAKSH